MRLCVKIEREILRPLLLNDCLVFREHLTIEVECLLQRSILVEIAADRHKEARFPRGYGRGGVENVKLPAFGKENREFGGERQKNFKAPMPNKSQMCPDEQTRNGLHRENLRPAAPPRRSFARCSEHPQLGFAPVTLVANWTELLKQK
jgi:hypothetical protein